MLTSFKYDDWAKHLVQQNNIPVDQVRSILHALELLHSTTSFMLRSQVQVYTTAKYSKK